MATIDAVSQAASLYSTLIAFFRSESSSAYPSLTSPDPHEFRDYIGPIDYSEIYLMTLSNQKSNASFRNGAAIDTVHHASAVLREYGMCTNMKMSYVLNRASDAGIESAFYSTRGQLMDTQLKGNAR